MFTMAKARNVTFLGLIMIFAFLAAIIAGLGRFWGPKLPHNSLLYLGGVFLLLSVIMLIQTILLKEIRIRKIFFLITAISAMAIPLCAILHNVVSAVFHTEEPVFFIAAIFVFPALLIVGIIGSIVTIKK
jgi:hypothetical protein